MINLNDLLDEFIKPDVKPRKKLWTKKAERINDLEERAAKCRRIQDMMKMQGWQKDVREAITKSLRTGFGALLRPSSLQLSESEIKTILSGMHSHLAYVSELLYFIEDGKKAGIELERLRK